MKTVLLLLLLLPLDALADSLTEQQMQEYVNATAQGSVPNADVTEADAVEGPIVVMHEVGSIFNGNSGPVTPQFPTEVNPASALPLIDVNTLPAQWYFEAYKRRAISEGKPEMYYVNIAIADSIKAREIQSRAERDQATCGSGFEIYPDSGICSKFGGHVEAEQNYYHCSLNNYQLALRNGELEAKCGYGAPSASVCMDVGAVADGGGLWKPEADPKARCKGGTTILLDKKYDGVTAMQILDSNKQFIMDASYFGKLADGRVRFCAEGRPGSSFGQGPIHIKYSYGLNECRKVTNPANRED